ncbi:GNAT family N-acetyltransferase [Candidatus Micrarchaeota archaeon]|nr:GNAT family N-acetyltransferase [Candidatus Micrarchaeota archaeon]
MDSFPMELKLKDGRLARVSFINKKDDTRGFLIFINKLIGERSCIIYDKKFTLKQEEGWKKTQLEALKKRDGYTLVAKIDGKIAGTSGAKKGAYKERGNVCLGIAIAKEFRGLGLGEALLKLNMRTAKRFFKPRPRNIYLSVFETNKPAYALYKKLGFKEFARLPKWLLHRGEYRDHIFMKYE